MKILTGFGYAASLILLLSYTGVAVCLMGVVFVADKAAELIDHRP